jgi:hypothetical protein
MDMAKRDRFWRGEIETREHAAKIVRYCAIGFMIFGGLACVAVARPPYDIYKLSGPLLIFIPALILFRTKSLAAARVLFAISALGLAMGVVTAVYMAISGSGLEDLIISTLMLIWLVPLFAAMRACKAAKYLRGPQSDTTITEKNSGPWHRYFHFCISKIVIATNWFRQLPLSTVLITAITIAVMCFFLIHNYLPRVGLIWNIMHGEIFLQPECPPYDLISPDGTAAAPPTGCGSTLPYRWILIAVAAFVALWAIIRRPKAS